MASHKTAGDLISGDTFLLAGNHCKVLDIYATDDMDRIKMAFSASSDESRHVRHILILEKRTSFITY